jgi:riboflavin kinase, archaea type
MWRLVFVKPMAAPRVAPEDKELLKQLAKIGGLHDHVFISSSELAERIGVSQQTASRKILELLDAGLILRRMGTRKQHIRVSQSGLEILRHEFADYKQLFAGGERVVIRGHVVTGLGEGRYYISREGYRKAFSRLLGFDPFPGTLNIEVDPLDREKVAELKDTDGLMIEEFQSEGRTFGAVKCFRATVGEVEAAAIFPLRSHHVHVLELISPFGLREKLSLVDGQDVQVSLDLPGILASPE